MSTFNCWSDSSVYYEQGNLVVGEIIYLHSQLKGIMRK